MDIKTIVISSACLLLISCGGGSSSSDSSTTDTGTTDTQADGTENNLKECLVSRVAMTPSSGTVSKKSTALRADIDVQFPVGVVDFDIGARMCQAGHCDDGYHKEVELIWNDPADSKQVSGSTGRAYLSFGMRRDSHYGPQLGQYDEVRVKVTAKKADGSTSKCEVTKKVNFTLVE